MAMSERACCTGRLLARGDRRGMTVSIVVVLPLAVSGSLPHVPMD